MLRIVGKTVIIYMHAPPKIIVTYDIRVVSHSLLEGFVVSSNDFLRILVIELLPTILCLTRVLQLKINVHCMS
jgi:hypothetical protein